MMHSTLTTIMSIYLFLSLNAVFAFFFFAASLLRRALWEQV